MTHSTTGMHRADPWETLRSEFPVLAHYAYLNTGTFGPLPRCTLRAIIEITEQELRDGRANPAYFDHVEDARSDIRKHLAATINARVHDVLITSATTTGCQIVTSGLRLRAGDEVVTTDLEHNTFITALRASEATVTIASLRNADADLMVQRIASLVTPSTRLIALSHVSWMDGRLLPVSEIRALGPPVLVDAAQSVGAIPVDVETLGCDFLTFPGQKWLLGPDAVGGLYVHPDWHERLHVSLPSEYGHQPWQGQAVDVPRAGAERFTQGPIALSMLAAFARSLALGAELGNNRFTRAAQMTELFRHEISRRFEVFTQPGQSTLLAFDPGENADEVRKRLSEAKVIVRTVQPENWIRLSVGYWNNTDDLNRLLTAIPVRPLT